VARGRTYEVGLEARGKIVGDELPIIPERSTSDFAALQKFRRVRAGEQTNKRGRENREKRRGKSWCRAQKGRHG